MSVSSMYRAILPLALRREREARLGARQGAGDQLGGVAADGRAVLEAVAGAGADEQHVGPLGVEIDQEVAIGAVLILADPSLVERAAAQGREAPLHEGAHFGEGGGGGGAVALVRVDRRAVLVVGDLEAAALEVREAVEDVAGVEVGPAGEAA